MIRAEGARMDVPKLSCILLAIMMAFFDAEAGPVGVQRAEMGVSAASLRIEYADNPIGIDVEQPRLSWRLQSEERGAVQTAYQIQVATNPAALGRGEELLWDTGRIASDQSTHLEYEGPALASRQRYFWRVRVWDGSDRPSPWSEPAFWEMGLLEPSDWVVQWIRPDLEEDTTTSNPAPMLRGAFQVEGAVSEARAYVTALGLYEMEINGRRVGDELFTPGWTSYDTRLQYQTYDVTDLLRGGENAVGAMLGDGWYRGRLGWVSQRNTYGKELALLAQIVIRYRDGREQVVGTGEAWTASTGPILFSDIYNGEKYDARLEKEGWSRPGFDDSEWAAVRVIDHPRTILVAAAGPPVRRIQELKPIEILRTPAGEVVFDLGQNMVGWVRLSVHGPRGTAIHLQHAEVLDREGNFYTDNLRSAKAATEYVLKGDGEEVYEPRFTFQGFRYVSVEGFPGEPTLDDITGIVIHSDMPPAGTFETSHPLINQLQQNIVWGQKGNFLDVPTDTPARDERLGWTGDAQAFASTAAFNFDVAGFFTKWLLDLAADQKPGGSVPHVIPDVLSRGHQGGGGSAGWADAATIIPWAVYQAYGDKRILEQQYESMKKWVEFGRTQAGEDLVWESGFHFGDWLAFATTRSDYPGATTDKDFLATAFFAHSTDLLARSADVLGRLEDAREYRALFEDVKAAFNREYVSATGRLSPNTQTAYALALEFDLLPEELRAEAGRRLAEDVRRFGHLTTGFLGTPHLNHALSNTGHLDEAYMLLRREKYPSWLYPITQGATTMWERWDGIKPDSSFQDVGMNSFNHYAYGAIGDWMYRTLAGIDLDPSAPGYKHSFIRPQPGGGFTSVSAGLHTLYGEVGSSWELVGDQFQLTVRVPPNTTATVRLPEAPMEQVRESGRAVARAEGVTRVYEEADAVIVEIGSGEYRFAYDAAELAARLRGGE